MEAELRQATSSAAVRVQPRQGWREVVFSVPEARRALPYIARIASDAAEAFCSVHECREALGRIAVIADRQRKREVCEQCDRAIRRLNSAIDDCNAVGAHLIDLPNGRVSLPGLIEDRPVCFVWSLGEDVRTAWADLD